LPAFAAIGPLSISLPESAPNDDQKSRARYLLPGLQEIQRAGQIREDSLSEAAPALPGYGGFSMNRNSASTLMIPWGHPVMEEISAESDKRIPVITTNGVTMLLEHQKRGLPMPDGWQQAVIKYRQAKMRLWQITTAEFNEERAVYEKAMRLCQKLLDGGNIDEWR
jgi:hypothetical protein